jgi:hypothetical protein
MQLWNGHLICKKKTQALRLVPLILNRVHLGLENISLRGEA